jgi:hypothetical protein
MVTALQLVSNIHLVMLRLTNMQFVGHNAFLRWKAIQSVAFEEDGQGKKLFLIIFTYSNFDSQILV